MNKKIKHFIQHLNHEVGDEDKAEEFIENALPSIGLIVMYFNSLESTLDSVLCENFTDRTDSLGLIVLNKLNYSSKVDLFKRFCDDFQVGIERKLESYDEIIANLRESGRLRNMVVHANWESTDDEGYAFIKLKMSKNGMYQEYVQFTEASLERIIELIFKTRLELYEFWEHRNDVLYGRT